MVAEHARRMEIHLGELKLSEQADVNCWHFQLGEDVGRCESARFPSVPRAMA